MKKTKIAISVDQQLLDVIDSKVDGSVIRSRSQAFEYFVSKGLSDSAVTTAVILAHRNHHHALLQKIDGTSLIKKQIQFFQKHGINKIFLVTQHSADINDILKETADAPIATEIKLGDGKGNAQALLAIKKDINAPFVVMSGDTFNDFDLSKMIKKSADTSAIGTMGLMTREQPQEYGTAILDGDYIVDFIEKPKDNPTTIVNAGIYILKPSVFELLEKEQSLERAIFPKLARMKQLVGFFTYGKYMHVE